MTTVNMTAEKMADTNVRQMLVHVTERKPSAVSSVHLSKLAWLVWHEHRDRLPEVQEALSSLTDLRKKRALYLLDSLRRYPVVPDDRAAKLKTFLLSYSRLKPKEPSEQVRKLLQSYKLDKVAADWGLEEDARKKFQTLLPFQTRHFAAKLSSGKALLRN